MKKLALIDSDSIIYILAWTHRESKDVELMETQVDSIMCAILNMVEADAYCTFLSERSFRHDVYKYKPYKGSRPEPGEHVVFWKPIIIKMLTNTWAAYSHAGLEADDLVSVYAEKYGNNHDIIVCSPDKDLNQIPGKHFDYKKGEGCMIDAATALYTFWVQMLTGDTTDNIAGIPGLGPKKVTDLIVKGHTLQDYYFTVLSQYEKYFGAFYGPIIFEETRCAIEMMCRQHPLWRTYASVLTSPLMPSPNTYERQSVADTALLKELGWVS